MNKSQLVEVVAIKSGVKKKEAELVVNALTETILDSMKNGEKVQIVGFGGFEVRERPGRVARNPRTGEQIEIESSKAPVFKAGKALKDSVNK
jgi:DNA-binding protein HU-beta